MKKIDSEADFQDWCNERCEFLKRIHSAHWQDFSDYEHDVADLNLCWKGKEYWLELKFNRFKLLYSGYDRFRWSSLQSGQKSWLRKREIAGSVAGILGYAKTYGEGRQYNGLDYIVFTTVDQYDEMQRREYCAGAMILSPRSVAAHLVPRAGDLLAFIEAGAAGGSSNV